MFRVANELIYERFWAWNLYAKTNPKLCNIGQCFSLRCIVFTANMGKTTEGKKVRNDLQLRREKTFKMKAQLRREQKFELTYNYGGKTSSK